MAVPALPHGWFEAFDQGDRYYYSSFGETTWHRPTAAASAPLPLVVLPPNLPQIVPMQQQKPKSATVTERRPPQSQPNQTPRRKNQTDDKTFAFLVNVELTVRRLDCHDDIRPNQGDYRDSTLAALTVAQSPKSNQLNISLREGPFRVKPNIFYYYSEESAKARAKPCEKLEIILRLGFLNADDRNRFSAWVLDGEFKDWQARRHATYMARMELSREQATEGLRAPLNWEPMQTKLQFETGKSARTTQLSSTLHFEVRWTELLDPTLLLPSLFLQVCHVKRPAVMSAMSYFVWRVSGFRERTSERPICILCDDRRNLGSREALLLHISMLHKHFTCRVTTERSSKTATLILSLRQVAPASIDSEHVDTRGNGAPLPDVVETANGEQPVPDVTIANVKSTEGQNIDSPVYMASHAKAPAKEDTKDLLHDWNFEQPVALSDECLNSADVVATKNQDATKLEEGTANALKRKASTPPVESPSKKAKQISNDCLRTAEHTGQDPPEPAFKKSPGHLASIPSKAKPPVVATVSKKVEPTPVIVKSGISPDPKMEAVSAYRRKKKSDRPRCDWSGKDLIVIDDDNDVANQNIETRIDTRVVTDKSATTPSSAERKSQRIRLMTKSDDVASQGDVDAASHAHDEKEDSTLQATAGLTAADVAAVDSEHVTDQPDKSSSISTQSSGSSGVKFRLVMSNRSRTSSAKPSQTPSSMKEVAASPLKPSSVPRAKRRKIHGSNESTSPTDGGILRRNAIAGEIRLPSDTRTPSLSAGPRIKLNLNRSTDTQSAWSSISAPSVSAKSPEATPGATASPKYAPSPSTLTSVKTTRSTGEAPAATAQRDVSSGPMPMFPSTSAHKRRPGRPSALTSKAARKHCSNTDRIAQNSPTKSQTNALNFIVVRKQSLTSETTSQSSSTVPPRRSLTSKAARKFISKHDTSPQTSFTRPEKDIPKADGDAQTSTESANTSRPTLHHPPAPPGITFYDPLSKQAIPKRAPLPIYDSDHPSSRQIQHFRSSMVQSHTRMILDQSSVPMSEKRFTALWDAHIISIGGIKGDRFLSGVIQTFVDKFLMVFAWDEQMATVFRARLGEWRSIGVIDDLCLFTTVQALRAAPEKPWIDMDADAEALWQTVLDMEKPRLGECRICHEDIENLKDGVVCMGEPHCTIGRTCPVKEGEGEHFQRLGGPMHRACVAECLSNLKEDLEGSACRGCKGASA